MFVRRTLSVPHAVALAVLSVRFFRTVPVATAFSSFTNGDTSKESILASMLGGDYTNTNNNNNNKNILFHHVDETVSTQELARSLLQQRSKDNNSNNNDSIEQEDYSLLAVTANTQTQGRGTSGREWVSQQGNVFLTMAVPIRRVPVTITLLPLQVGVLVAERLDKLIKGLLLSTTTTTTVLPSVSVKWPNDVLVGNDKIAGTLIESENVDNDLWMLIGIGVNLLQTPTVPLEGRPATSLQQLLLEASSGPNEDNESNTVMTLPETTAQVFAQDLAVAMERWLSDPASTSDAVLQQWKGWARFGKAQTLRDTGEQVTPIDVQADGQLKVVGADGKERLLVADYLY